MPVEIRELIIRTEISVGDKNARPGARDKELALLRRKLLEECKRMIAANLKKDSYKR
jgi:hypothetical protein